MSPKISQLPYAGGLEALRPLDEFSHERFLWIILVAGVHVGGSGIADEGIVLEFADAPAVHLVHLKQHSVQ